MIHKIFETVIYYPKKTLLILALITTFWATFIPSLKLDFSVEDLFSEYDLSAREYQSFKSNFGREDNIITLIYKPKDFLSQDLYKKLDDIIYQLEDFNEVNTVVSLFNLSDIDSNAWIGDFMSPNWNNTRLNNALRYIQKRSHNWE